MMVVGRDAVAGDFREDVARRAPRPCAKFSSARRAAPSPRTRPLRAPSNGPAFFRRGRLQRIESDKDQFGDAHRSRRSGRARSVRSGCTRKACPIAFVPEAQALAITWQGDGQAARFERVDRGLLRRVICDPGRQTRRARLRSLEGAVILLAETHPAARCPDDGQFRAEIRAPARATPRARGSSCARRDGDDALAVVRHGLCQPCILPPGRRWCSGIARPGTASTGEMQSRAFAQGLQGGREPGPERADRTLGDDRDAGLDLPRLRWFVGPGHFLGKSPPLILLALTANPPYIAARNSGSGRW